MPHHAKHAVSALVVYVLTLSSVSAIIAAPPAKAAGHAAIATVELA